MQSKILRKLGVLAASVALVFGCGDDDGGGNSTTAGSGGSAGSSTTGGGGVTGGGASNRGGMSGNNSSTGGSAPTGCEGLSPMTGEACDDNGLVCPNELGSCVCQRRGGQREWECFELGGGEGGSTSTLGGQGPGGEGPGGEGPGGAGGAAQGGEGWGGAPIGGVGGEGGG